MTNYYNLLTEVVRLLRPCGIFLSCEWSRFLAFHPAYSPRGPATEAPAIPSFFALLHAALALRRLLPVFPPVAPLIAHMGAFEEITTREYYMPVGPWHPDPAMKALGSAFRAMFLRYTESVRPMLVESGLVSVDELDDVYVRMECEVREAEGLLAVFNTVHARKI